MRKTITLIAAVALLGSAIGVWASATKPANSAFAGQSISIDTLELTSTAKDLPVQQADAF